MLRVLIVDDERLARERLARAIADIENAEVVGEAQSGNEALKAIAQYAPSVVLLDIEMPDGDGFDVITGVLDQPDLPEFVFITAFNQYAVDAFEHGAADYLLKPVAFDRLTVALARAQDRIRLRTADERADRLYRLCQSLREDRSQSQKSDGVWFRQGSTTVRIIPAEIIYARADRDYVEIVTTSKKLHLRCTMTSLMKRLGTEDFLRVHRSYIVQNRLVRSVRRIDKYKSEVELEGGVKLPIGASFSAAINDYLKGAAVD
ncbi:MAG: LytTR family DNA-binding domain-containing protein [Pseudomonadota bacterium]